MNPFTDTPPAEEGEDLIRRAQEGERAALEAIVREHQAWIYNTAVRMVYDPELAADITQDVLLKMITRLRGFAHRSSFRTWLYRILANHVLDLKKTGSERLAGSFSKYGKLLDRLPDLEMPDPQGLPVDARLIYDETRVSCLTGMLMCLDRDSRLAFVLGGIWGADSEVGSRILDISPASFRQKLSRARKRLASFLAGRCGWMKSENPCHCHRKAKALMDAGYLDPRNLLFNRGALGRVKDLVRERSLKRDRFLESRTDELYADTPFMEPPDFVAYLHRLLESPAVKELYQLE